MLWMKLVLHKRGEKTQKNSNSLALIGNVTREPLAFETIQQSNQRNKWFDKSFDILICVFT